MSAFRLFSFNNFSNCRGILCTRNAYIGQEGQKMSVSNKMMLKLGLPPQPKKPCTAYIKFSMQRRKELKDIDSTIPHKDVMKKIAEDWQKYEPEKKKELQIEYLTEMDSYMKHFKKYKESITPEQKLIIENAKIKENYLKKQSTLRKKKEDLGKPKKPCTAFIKYMQEKKEGRDKSLNFSEWVKQLSLEWNVLPLNVKEKYMKESEIEMEKFKKDLLIWEENMLRQGHSDVVRNKELLDSSRTKST